jgi:DNA gyrase subunit A
LRLSEIQAKAILEMRLQRLVSLEIDKVREEYAEVLAKIEYYRSILASDQLQRDIIKQELDEINEKFGDKSEN